MKIGFLGAGHLGKSIIEGLLNSKKYQKMDFKIVVASNSSLEYFEQRQFQVSKNWNFLIDCEVLIIALRPNDIKMLSNQLSSTFKKQQIILSVAAGISLQDLQNIFLNGLITRVMPNTSCQFNQSMTMITKEGNKEANDKGQEIFNLLGRTVFLTEEKIHVFIAICGSAIAYLYYWLEPLMQLSLDNDISLEDSKIILANLLIGAAANIEHNNATLQDLQNQVTVPNGTTIEAIKVFDQNNFKTTIAKAIKAVEKRSKELE